MSWPGRRLACTRFLPLRLLGCFQWPQWLPVFSPGKQLLSPCALSARRSAQSMWCIFPVRSAPVVSWPWVPVTSVGVCAAARRGPVSPERLPCLCPVAPPIPVAQHPRVVLDGSRFICLECGRFAALSRGRKAWGDIPCRRVRGFVRRTAHLVVHDLGARAHQIVVEGGRMSCTACLRSVLVGGHHRFLRSFCRAAPHA